MSRMNQLLDRLRQLLLGQQANADDPSEASRPLTAPAGEFQAPLALDEQALASLLQQIQLTKAGQYTCAETAELLDEYVDLVASHEEAASLLPLVKGHLDHCVDCTEKYEILLDIVQQEE